MIINGYSSQLNEDMKNDVSPAILSKGDYFTDEDSDSYEVLDSRKVNSEVILKVREVNGDVGEVSYITAGGCNDRVYTITENEFNRLKKLNMKHWISAIVINRDDTATEVYYQPNGKFNISYSTAKRMTMSEAKKK